MRPCRSTIVRFNRLCLAKLISTLTKGETQEVEILVLKFAVYFVKAAPLSSGQSKEVMLPQGQRVSCSHFITFGLVLIPIYA